MKNFFNPKEFNEAVEIGNCLKFALMQKGEPDDGKCWSFTIPCDPDTGRPFGGYETPVKSFVSFAAKKGLQVRLVSSIEETEGKVSFFLWGWFRNRTILGFANDDFHIVRRNADGTYVHKADNSKRTVAEVTTLEDVRKEYDETPYIFVLEE